MLSSQCLSTGSVPPRCHARHQQHLRSCFHQAPFRRLLHRRKTFQLRLQHQKPSCNASAGGGASSDEEYNSIYSILPGDSESWTHLPCTVQLTSVSLLSGLIRSLNTVPEFRQYSQPQFELLTFLLQVNRHCYTQRCRHLTARQNLPCHHLTPLRRLMALR